jgi:hypothetical protein
VATTQEKALDAVNGGSGPGGETVVYLVTMKGHFTSPRGFTPFSGHRAHASTYNYQYVVVSAMTWTWRPAFSVIAGGFRRKPPPVAPSSLGPVTWLKR